MSSEPLPTGLLFGFLGVTAILGLSTLLAPLRGFAWMAHAGANSIVVYLGFFIPLTLLVRFAWAGQWPVDIHTLATLVVLFSVAAPLLLFHLTRNTPLRYLFVRPAWAHWPMPAVRAQVEATPPSSGERAPGSASASRLPS